MHGILIYTIGGVKGPGDFYEAIRSYGGFSVTVLDRGVGCCRQTCSSAAAGRQNLFGGGYTACIQEVQLSVK